MAVVTIYSDFRAPKIVSHCFHCFPHLFAMKWWDWMPWPSFLNAELFFFFEFLKCIYLFQLETNYLAILWWVLPYIDMNQPWVYMCSPSWTPFHLLPHPIPQGHPNAPALNTLSHASNLDSWSVSHMIIYMFQCYSLKSSHPRFLPQSPKVCSLSLSLFCYLTYWVIVTIFLNSIYMC